LKPRPEWLSGRATHS